MSQTMNATVTLARTAELVSVQVAGKGRVTSAPAGIGCPGRCSHTFAAGAVRLTAKPAHGWRFTGWNGSCSGRGSCVVSAARNVVRARFARVA
jgi:hypothetical protein